MHGRVDAAGLVGLHIFSAITIVFLFYGLDGPFFLVTAGSPALLSSYYNYIGMHRRFLGIVKKLQRIGPLHLYRGEWNVYTGAY